MTGSIALTTGEIRWKGPWTASVHDELQAISPTDAEIALAFFNKKFPSVDVGAEWNALPRAPAGSEGAGVWAGLHQLGAALAEIAQHKALQEADFVREAFGKAAEDCRYIARNGDLTTLTAAHASTLHPHVKAIDQLARGWRGTDSEEVRSQANLHVMPTLIGLAQTLSVIQACLAFAGHVGGEENVAARIQGRVDAAIARTEADLLARRAAAEEAGRRLADLRVEAEQTMLIVGNAAGASVAKGAGHTFLATANAHHVAARDWAMIAAGFMCTAIIGAVCFICMTGAVSTTTTWQMVVSTGAPRALLASLLVTASLWCARMSSLHRRAEIEDRHRANALENYQGLMGAARQDEEARRAVLIALTSSVFTRPATSEGPRPQLAFADQAAELARALYSQK